MDLLEDCSRNNFRHTIRDMLPISLSFSHIASCETRPIKKTAHLERTRRYSHNSKLDHRLARGIKKQSVVKLDEKNDDLI